MSILDELTKIVNLILKPRESVKTNVADRTTFEREISDETTYGFVTLFQSSAMRLSQDDADLFFKLMWSLQLYVNVKHGLVPEAMTIESLARCNPEQKKQVRDALFADITVIDDFIVHNPAVILPRGARHYWEVETLLAGEFFVERLLRRHAIFIRNDCAYAVLVRHDAFHDIFARVTLPIYVRTVLLPFKGRIVYDGMLESYNVYFGGSIRSNLRETYLLAKQRGKIIKSLDPLDDGHRKQKAW